MSLRPFLLAALLFFAGSRLFSAQDQLQTLHGHCSIAPSAMSGRVQFEMEDGDCDSSDRHCHNHDNDEMPLSNFTGLALADFEREGAHLEAKIVAEAGTITCAGEVHGLALTGDYTFLPDSSFVERMGKLGFTGFSSEKLEAFTLFHIETSWVQSLLEAGVTDMDTGKILALKIFKIDAGYVKEMAAIGYPNLSAEKLISFGVQGVNADEVKQYRALGYQPNADELIQMRIFKVTPDFIQRMHDRGLGNLTISKLVQIRIFKLAD
ncbi:MAG: hypothetical protein WA891_18405 [Acidobacteriaceae bacterium]